MSENKEGSELQPIIIKRVKKVEGGHHGGAWKVAYADFVTAMMAFFLLLWLLNVTTSEQKSAISSYFEPTPEKIADPDSGSGGVMGGTSISPIGTMTEEKQPVIPASTTGAEVRGPPQEIADDPQDPAEIDRQALEEQLRKEEEARFEQLQEELKRAIEESEDLKELAESVVMDMTPEGLRIQIIVKEGKPLFPSGSADMYDYTRKLLEKVGEVATKLPNDLSVRGHTDAHQYAPGAKYTNWELSADRANSSRRVLLDGGIPGKRMANVMGKADTEPFIEDNPFDPQNRRISIILLHETVEDALESGSLDKPKDSNGSGSTPQKKPIVPFKRTPGEVQFP